MTGRFFYCTSKWMKGVRMKHMMLPKELLAILWICFSAFSAYHAPQPLFPSIRETFSLAPSTVTLLTTCVIFPLGLSPIFYGLFLNKLPLVRTLVAAQIIYLLALLPAPLGGGWHALLFGRFMQGVSLPALILCAMTYISSLWEGKKLQQYMAYYSVSLMLGGFAGRVIAGFAEEVTGNWRMAFAVMAVTVLSAVPCSLMLPAVRTAGMKTVDFRALGSFFRQKGMLRLLCIAPCIVVVNNSLLNILPFRLREIDPSISALDISIVYVGVILCASVGIFSSRLIRFFGTEMRTVMFGIVVFLGFLPLMAVPSPMALFFIMICMNFGYSFFYCCMPGVVNRYSHAERSVTNGVFLTFYYLSAAVGSYVPAVIYENFGFWTYSGSMMTLTAVALFMAFLMRGIRLDDEKKSGEA